jgi:TrmH family RNA methyltransferase
MPQTLPRAGLSYRHQKVQRLRRLISRRSAREAERVFVAEGAKVVDEALAGGAPIEALYVAPEGRDAPVVSAAHDRGARVYDLESGVMERVAGTVTPQPVLAVVGYIDVALAAVRDRRTNAPLIVCVDLRDPGNAGTVLRSAEASGAAAVICCDGTVDIYNPKTVRASAGALFHVPVVSGGNPLEVLDEMTSWGVRRLATVARGGAVYDEFDLGRGVAFVIGNEAHGLPASLAGHIDATISIPMAGRSESLNVGMAAAVLCFEAARQRRAAGEQA